ncbi:MAG: hypothetical protein QCH99_08415 [Candidatus Bathyarchaeota archaeon]|nr:hypothetical protein [Candidatus Bathyarchaeum tardum]WGM89898.1 MAG: hypothetical protein NUK63_01905 [Candidatus Bathyarchaeum tardum]
MNDYLYQISLVMVTAGIMWTILGNKTTIRTSSTTNKRWSIKGQEGFVLIALGFVIMIISKYVP